MAASSEVRRREHELASLDAGGEGNGVAAARLADARRIDRRAAVQAGDVGAVLVIAAGAADQAGVEGRGDRPAFLDGLDGHGEEAHRMAAEGDLETVEGGTP